MSIVKHLGGGLGGGLFINYGSGAGIGVGDDLNNSFSRNETH